LKQKLRLLTRPGCHLCEDFLDELRTAFGTRFEIEEACVDDDPQWQARFGREIPVLLAPDGAVLCRTRFDAAALRPFIEA
jgi:hypothetical protein